MAAVCALAGVWLGGWKWGFVAILCGWGAVGVFNVRNHSLATAEDGLLALGSAHAEARLTEDPKSRGHFWSGPAVLREGLHAGAKVFWEGRGEVPVAGSVVRARGNFEKLPERRNPGEFDKAAWLRSQGVAVIFRTIGEGEVETGPRARFGARIRQGFREAVTDGLPPDSREARVILAVVMGVRPTDSEELVTTFRHSGTLHVFSVSGLHVAMVGTIGWLLLRGLGVPRRMAVFALLPLIFGYAWITGNGPPAVRSAWMMGVFLGAFVFRRRPDLLNSLGAVLLVALLWDGRLLFQTGVQLSYGVVAAIALGTAWATKAFAWMKNPDLYLPEGLMNRRQILWLRFRQWLAGSLAVSSAACAGSMPLSAYHFGIVTPISVLASAVVVPVVWLMLACALFAAAFYPLVPAVSRTANRANGYVSMICVGAAETFASVPGGHFSTRGTRRPFLLVYDLDYGAGAACFSAGGEGAVLIDCGDAFAFRQRIIPSLRELGVRPDSVVITHPDGGHLGGGSTVMEALPLKQVLLPVELSRSPAFRSWTNDAGALPIRRLVPVAGQVIPFPGGARLEILHVPDPLAQNSAADDRVMLPRLHWGGWKILFTSDSGAKAEAELLASGKDLSADVIIAGRHRHDLTLGDRFLDAVEPRVIIASNSAFPVEERLSRRQADYWKSRGIDVVDQARTGGVTLHIANDGRLQIAGFVDGSSLMLNRR